MKMWVFIILIFTDLINRSSVGHALVSKFPDFLVISAFPDNRDRLYRNLIRV